MTEMLPAPIETPPSSAAIDPALADSARAKAAAVIAPMDLLMELFAEEAALVEAHAMDALKDLVPRKQALGRAYEDALRALRLDTAAQAALDAETRAAMREKAEAFNAALTANTGLLKVQTDVSQKVVDAIVAAINHQRLQETGYGPARPGSRGGGGYRSPAPTSATLNQTL